MPVIATELQKIVNTKNAYIDSLIKQFETEYGTISKDILNSLKTLYRSGQWDYDTVLGVFQQAGYPETIQGFVEQYAETMKFAKEVAAYSGTEFLLSEKGMDAIGFMQEQHAQGLIKGMEKYAQTLVEMGVKHTIEGTGFNQLVADLQSELDVMGRNAKIEISEGIKTFDRAIASEQFKEAGIELFVYVGPDDELTRDSCAEVLHDPRQETGWTRDDIADSPVSFIGGGGWNCRHDWMPYIEGFE